MLILNIMRKKGAKTFYVDKEVTDFLFDFFNYIEVKSLSSLINDFLVACSRSIPSHYTSAKTIEEKIQVYRSFKNKLIEELKKQLDKM